MTLVGGWLLGLLLGAAHAFEPDHLAAMATLLSTGPTAVRPARLGAWWGAGHAVTLLAVGGALVSFRLAMSPSLASAFESGVGLLLVALGVRSIVSAARPHARHHVHLGGMTLRQPILVGLVHGLAGTGALTALALASMPSVPAALVYLVLFCAGSLVAMSVATGLIGRAFAATGRRRRALAVGAGALSLLLGARMLLVG